MEVLISKEAAKPNSNLHFRACVLLLMLFFGSEILISQNLPDSVLKAHNVSRVIREDYNLPPNKPAPRYIIGFVYDLGSKEPIAYVPMHVKGSKINFQTNKIGAYCFDLNEVPDSIGTIIIQIFFINYEPKEIIVPPNAVSNAIFDIGLKGKPGIECFNESDLPKPSKKSKREQSKKHEK